MPSKMYRFNISKSGLQIHDKIDPNDDELWLPIDKLENILKSNLLGKKFSGLPLRTRSKIIKSEIWKILGYPVPKTFQKTKPRFLGQQFDVYIQKSNNLQIWNEQIEPARRYVIIKLSSDDEIIGLRVFSGNELAKLDKTGTLTQKYQARILVDKSKSELIAAEDTKNISRLIERTSMINLGDYSPNESPKRGMLLPISTIFNILVKLVNTSFPDTGSDQERNRGAKLHEIVCRKLGFKTYQDDGRFPDINHQLLEIKLQTSSAIDLGLIRPDSDKPLALTEIDGIKIRHCDVRYVIFYAEISNDLVILKNLLITTGEKFFTRFPQFQGKIISRKLKIPISDKLFE